jgi:type I restriction enzyme S subunit
MKYGLPRAAIEKICSVFARFAPIEKAVLYGSRAKGNFKPGSDIDLTLFGENLTSAQVGEIAEALDDLLLPYTIDLSLYAELNHAKLREHIDRVGVVFFKRGSAGQHQGAAMKKGWQTKSLGDLCDILDHKRKPITKCDRVAGKYPYYGATGILDHVEGYLFDEPLVLVGEDGAKWESGENTAFAIEGKCWVNNHAHVLRPHRTEILDNWLIHFLHHSDLTEFVSGLTVPKLNQGSLREIPIPVPPLPEQHRIVAILDEAFAGIATAKANAEKNLQNARAIFQSHLQSVFTQQGAGWVEKRLKECFRLKSGDGLTSKAMNGGRYSVFGGNGIAGEHDEFNLLGDNVIIGRVGALCGNARHITENIWLTDNAFKIVDPSFEFDGSFLTYLLNFKNLRSFARQAAQPVISNSSLKDLLLPFPEIAKQKKIAAQLDALTSETQRLASLYERKLDALEALKKSLLHQAFAGEL